VLRGSVLHDGSVAAAGAALAKGIEVPTGHRAQGVPAKVVAAAHPSPAVIATGARRYAQMARHYAEAGIGVTGLDLEPRFRLPSGADKC
jgi:carbonic anhydrase/acetyltransferase-like protein (isoleucine patch superfamily)